MKKIVFFICSFFLIVTSIKCLELPIEVTADSVILVNLDTDQVVYEKNPDKEQILASLTKIMTAYTVINNVEDLNKKVTITAEDLYNLYGFTCAGLEEGDKVSYLDLLYAMMLPSGADASQALAIHTAGSVEEFNNLMNNEAKKLGLRNSNFADSYGGDDNNISTAREMSRLIKEALKNETFKKVFSTNQKTLSNGLIVYNYTRNYEVFHGLDENLLTGNKSGYTPEAGLLLASTATIKDTNYMLIVMKCEVNDYVSTHILETHSIYNYLSTISFGSKTVIEKDEILKRIKVENGTINEYVVTAEKDVTITLPTEELDKITLDYHITDKITPSNKVGDNLGYVDVIVDDTVITTYNVYLKDEIFSYQEETKSSLTIIIAITFIIVVLLCTNLFSKKKRKFK